MPAQIAIDDCATTAGWENNDEIFNCFTSFKFFSVQLKLLCCTSLAFHCLQLPLATQKYHDNDMRNGIIKRRMWKWKFILPSSASIYHRFNARWGRRIYFTIFIRLGHIMSCLIFTVGTQQDNETEEPLEEPTIYNLHLYEKRNLSHFF